MHSFIALTHRGLYRLAVARESEAGTMKYITSTAVTTVINDTSPCALTQGYGPGNLQISEMWRKDQY